MTDSKKHAIIDENCDDCENISSNPSNNREFADVLKASASRRGILRGSLAGAAMGFLAPQAMAKDFGGDGDRRRKLVRFEPLSIEDATVDQTMPTIAAAYQYQTFIPWGTPIEPGATKPYNGDPSTRPTSAEATLQVGIGHDGIAFFPKKRYDDKDYYGRRYGDRNLSNRKGMLCVNHEFGRNTHVLGKAEPESLEDVRLAQNVLGVSVLAIEKQYDDSWDVVASDKTRRITANSPIAFSGPAADSPLLQNPAGNIPLGTINNCGCGVTPWGTYLTCEENFNLYFGTEDTSWSPDEYQGRYGVNSVGGRYYWHRFDKRFDIADEDYANEINRFGWVLEIDPEDATQKPTKRTALGRFKHEAIAIAESGNGRIAAYMGDDQRGDYCYKFVSAKSWRKAKRDGESPLDEGTLYVARFNEDGTGDWLELSMNVPALAAKFKDMAELLINTRVAADIVGATKMDRPEWTTIGQNKSVYWTLTNNDKKDEGQGEVNAANPEFENTDGHIIRTFDQDDYLGTKFRWEIYLLASSTRDTTYVFTDPDAAYADPYGRLFIGTDGGQPDGLQDQVVVFDTTKEKPEPKRLLVGVPSDELTGWAVTPNHRTAFVNVQHPGNGSPTLTNFPAPFDGVTIPRDATLIITKKAGGVVGS